MNKYTIGLDFGTDSVRALVVSKLDGKEVATAVSYYNRWKDGLYCEPSLSQYRQHPLDYLEAMDEVLVQSLGQLNEDVRKNIAGISVDTTGSTPIAVDKSGTPLALLNEFSENPNAMFVLWKDHTANQEALEINQLAHNWQIDYTKYVGGEYSSEWFWAKILHIIRNDEKVRSSAYSWVEHCDWISAFLTGNVNPTQLKRSRCAAGHKALWHSEFNGLPDEAFFTTLDPLLAGLRDRMFTETYTSDISIGNIDPKLADTYGLSPNVKIGVGAFDCHMGAVGANIQPFDFVRVMGTSTCDMVIVDPEIGNNTIVKGICGQVDGSIIAGMIGMEAGQSAYGDYYAWWQNLMLQPVKDILGEEATLNYQEKLIPYLSEKASLIEIKATDSVATDWINGRRTPDVDHTLKASFTGLDLSVDAVRIFKMIVEATAFGSRAILERFETQGIHIKQVVAIGGVAKKSPYVMQTLSDVLNMPIKVVKSEQACALGAAINAAVASGVYPNVQTAQKMMSSPVEKVYSPRETQASIYNTLYQKYIKIGKHTI
ncbi:MAG TPA: ribulokinase [Saprospiraceae bacterium]|nr:ribulokinase [Saprospiraceae bacterium]